MTSSVIGATGYDANVDRKKRSTSFQPGGWGDRLVFGYMFRVITGVLAVVVPALVVGVVGALNGWHLSQGLIILYGIICAVMVLAGEGLRLAVYESRIKSTDKLEVRKSDAIPDNVVAKLNNSPLVHSLSKRCFDVVFASLLITAFFPIFVIVSALIRFDSPGAIFFRQKRLGFRGRFVVIYKFRTMRVTETEVEFSREKNDARITRAGRVLRATALDELPQLINVLKGDMSLVGPRPLIPGEQNDVSMRYMDWMKPGLLGVQQFSRKSDDYTALEYYAIHQSLWLDFKYLIRAIIALFRVF